MGDSLSVGALSGQYDWSRSWTLPEPGRGLVAFTAQGTNDVHIAISAQNATSNPMYEIVIGGWGNGQSVIRRASQGQPVATSPTGLLSPGGLNPLWVSVNRVSGLIEVGRGVAGQGVILSFTDPSFIAGAQFVTFSSWDTPISYSAIVVSPLDFLSIGPQTGGYDFRRAWALPQAGRGILTFTAQGTNDVHVAISPVLAPNNPMYEIVIGGWGNGQSVIRRSPQGAAVVASPTGLLAPGGANPLWVSVDAGSQRIQVGRGAVGQDVILSYVDPAFIAGAQLITFSSWNTPIQYSAVKTRTLSQPVGGDLYNTMSIGDVGSYGFAAGTTFTQTFRSAIDSFPTELAMRMGNNQNGYQADVVIAVNGKECFRQRFYNLVQRTSDWATVFPIYGFNTEVLVGDSVSVSVTPDRDIGIAALRISDPNLPPSPLAGYGNINARFYLRGSTQPDPTTYPPPVVVPGSIRSTMGEGGSTWALGAGLSFTQSFTAIGGGVPSELGVVMGNNQNTFGCQVQLSVNGTQVFSHAYSGLVQRYSDWAVVFSLAGLTQAIKAGDQVSFTVTPDHEIGFSAIAFNEVGVSMGAFPRYGNCRSQFYLKV